MATNLKTLCYQVWMPLKKWARAILQRIRKKDGDDNQFNHPYIIY